MSSVKEYLFTDYPPAVTSMFCTTAFAVYLLASAVYYEFQPAPDHSMPKDYNRLLHNLSTYDLCEGDFSDPTDLSNFSSVSLLTYVQGSNALIYQDSAFHVLIDQNETDNYYITTDNKWDNVACTDGDCKVEKCVTISAPAELFPVYELGAGRQCTPKYLEDVDVYNLKLCNGSEVRDLKFEFKRRNEYAKSLTNRLRREMQQRLVEIALSLLVFNVVVVVFSLLYRKRKLQSSF